jgi:hypothetical protein
MRQAKFFENGQVFLDGVLPVLATLVSDKENDPRIEFPSTVRIIGTTTLHIFPFIFSWRALDVFSVMFLSLPAMNHFSTPRTVTHHYLFIQCFSVAWQSELKPEPTFLSFVSCARHHQVREAVLGAKIREDAAKAAAAKTPPPLDAPAFMSEEL